MVGLAPEALERRITKRTRAVLVVHLYGHPADMPTLSRFCRTHRLRLIEDAAHALGASVAGRPVGSWGDAACISLSRGKPVTGGEGGVLCTNQATVFERAVALTQHSVRQKYELSGRRRNQVGEFGYNFRIHPLAAVIATAEMERFHERSLSRMEFYGRLSQTLQGIPGIRAAHCASDCIHAYYRYCPTFVPEELAGGKLTRERYIEALAAEGVPLTGDPIGIPLYRRGPRRTYGRTLKGGYAVTDSRCTSIGLSLSSRIADCEPATEVIVTALRRAFAKVADHAVDILSSG